MAFYYFVVALIIPILCTFSIAWFYHTLLLESWHLCILGIHSNKIAKLNRHLYFFISRVSILLAHCQTVRASDFTMAEKSSSGTSDKTDGDEEPTINQDLVVTKYKMAADMVNKIMKQIIEKCVPGEKVRNLCEFGDSRLIEETSKVFKKEKEMKKGIAFPTCISVNNCVCHFSPLKSDKDVVLEDGDMVKIDLGAHVDGFIAVLAHTHVVNQSADNKITGRKADVVLAAQLASQVALRLVKPGSENSIVTDAVSRVCESFECKPIEGMLSHQLKRNVIDGEKAIIQNPNEAQRKEHEKCEFEVHEVYAIDVIITTGEGKGREQDSRTTVYKKTDTTYQLKMKASRAFFSDVEKHYGLMPFTLRTFEDEKKAKMGVVECVSHKLVEPFTVLYERQGEFVAQFKYTLLLMPNGPMRITTDFFDGNCFESEQSLQDEELKGLLALSANPKAAKKKKKKAQKLLAYDAAAAAPNDHGGSGDD